jgi:N6-L-threonylcarbamoyladenine synthase
MKKICLGLEGTAHTAGAGIVDENCKVLANVKHAHTTKKGGLIPRELADHHSEKFPEIIKEAVETAEIKWNDIDCVAYSKGPGIGNALSVTATAARMISLLHDKPIVPVNHSVAHIEIAKKMCSSKDPLILYVSGGNTQIIGYEAGKYRVYGETLDIGVGNLIDSFGRALGFGFPQGPKLDEIYFMKKNYIELPYTVKGMDVQFSGLLTAAERKIGKEPQNDLAYSLMHNAFAMIVEVTERALAQTGKKELLLTGGVAASNALREMCEKMCKKRKIAFKVCPKEYATDNGAMIAWTGLLKFKSGVFTTPEKAEIEQGFRVDLEEVTWI